VLIILLVLCSPATLLFAQSSRSNTFYATTLTRADAKRWPDVNSWIATVYRQDSVKLYDVVKEVPYDSPLPSIQTSDENGRSVVLNACEGWVEFYDGQGNRITRWSPFVDQSPDYERILKCSLSADRAAFLVSGTGMRRAHVVLTDLYGNTMMEAELKGKTAGEIFLSADGSYIVAGSYTSDDRIELVTIVLDQHGIILHELPVLFRHADVSDDSKEVVLSDRNRIVTVPVDGRTQGFSWTTDSKDDVITGVRFAGEHVAVVVERASVMTGVPIYKDPSLRIFAASGRMLMSRQMNGSSARAASLQVDERAIVVRSDRALLRVERDQLK
jgi:hypothetical protein